MRIPRSNVPDGSMAGYVRNGRTFMSPLMATGVIHLGDWVRDDLPDLLWPILVMAEQGTMGIKSFVSWQGDVQGRLSALDDVSFVADCLDGRLTGLDQLVERHPSAQAVVLESAKSLGLLQGSVTWILSSYDSRPAAWLTHGQTESTTPADLGVLARALVDVLRDGHKEALVKCLQIWSRVQARTFSSSGETIDLLKRYPNDLVTRSKADSVVRASWGASRAATLMVDAGRMDASVQWAKIFWVTNSMMSRCLRRSEIATDPDVESPVDKGAPVSEEDEATATPLGVPVTAMPQEGAHLQNLTSSILTSFYEAIDASPSDLHDSSRAEVVAGQVASVGRTLVMALAVPDLWCLEHGSHVNRALVECRVRMTWMARQESTIYQTYKSYGAGKAKLYARILDELPEEARMTEFEGALDELRRLSRDDEVLESRIVDTGDSFVPGKSLRQMAKEAGLEDFYRQSYQISSGVSHGEWWAMETHAMEQCVNVLHRGHLIPSFALNEGGNVAMASAWVNQFYSIVSTAMRVLAIDEEVEESYFAWLRPYLREAQSQDGASQDGASQDRASPR